MEPKLIEYYPGDILIPNPYGIGRGIDPNVIIHIIGYSMYEVNEKGGQWYGDYYKIKPIRRANGIISFLEKEVASKMYQLHYRSELGNVLYAY